MQMPVIECISFLNPKYLVKKRISEGNLVKFQLKIQIIKNSTYFGRLDRRQEDGIIIVLWKYKKVKYIKNCTAG